MKDFIKYEDDRSDCWNCKCKICKANYKEHKGNCSQHFTINKNCLSLDCFKSTSTPKTINSFTKQNNIAEIEKYISRENKCMNENCKIPL